ncbi:uncharacterized protein LOC127748962 isoform X2 [Frankliniella occidentalis]|nr:uncharacterized protein LOC127748962 isoform X2 [Frankliniella occidentalis]XP_052120967.1 uncharacterized protein LOC127748962 isoform X2 [Frankliniella occidentalis]
MRGTTPAVCLTLGLMCMVLTGVGVMGRTLGSQGLVSSLVDMVYAVSLLGCAMSQLFFAQNRKDVQAMLVRLHEVATELEHDLEGPEHRQERAELSLSARSAHKWFVGMRVYATLAAVSVMLPHFTTLKPVPAVWPSHPALDPPLAIIFALSGNSCCIAYSEFLSLQLVATISSAGMYRALGARLQRAVGKDEELESVARLHGELNSVATVQDALFSSYLPFYLLPPLGGTALATCGFLYGAFSSNFMSLVPQIFIIFMPLCLCGDDLQQTSGETLSLCGYSGNWLDWPPRARRLLHCVMARGTRPQLVYVKAFGHLDRKACLSVLKTWFSFLQTLTNLSGISPDGH